MRLSHADIYLCFFLFRSVFHPPRALFSTSLDFHLRQFKKKTTKISWSESSHLRNCLRLQKPIEITTMQPTLKSTITQRSIIRTFRCMMMKTKMLISTEMVSWFASDLNEVFDFEIMWAAFFFRSSETLVSFYTILSESPFGIYIYDIVG